jgi:hypothetical protein
MSKNIKYRQDGPFYVDGKEHKVMRLRKASPLLAEAGTVDLEHQARHHCIIPWLHQVHHRA